MAAVRRYESATFRVIEKWRAESQDFLRHALVTVRSDEKTFTDYTKALADMKALLKSMRKSFGDLGRAHIQLGREHNRRTKINRFPVELLMIIFQEAISDSAPISSLFIAAVCSQWRLVALECTGLWGTLNLAKMKPRHVELYRQRARGHPLTLISCDVFGRSSHRELLFSEIGAIEELDIVVPNTTPGASTSESSVNAVIEFLTTEAYMQLRMLKTISINLGQNHRSFFPCVLDKPFFGGRACALQHMKLTGTRFPWDHGFYSDLLTLKIHYQRIERSMHDRDICHVLRDCPRLHTFDLTIGPVIPFHTDDFQEDHLGSHTGTERIPLPFLRSLLIETPLTYAHYILSSIIADSLSEIILTTEGGDAETAHSLSLLIPPTVFAEVNMLDHESYESPSGFYKGSLHGYDLSKRPPIHGQESSPIYGYSWNIIVQPQPSSLNHRIFHALATVYVKARTQPLISQKATFTVLPPTPFMVHNISRHLQMFTLGAPGTMQTDGHCDVEKIFSLSARPGHDSTQPETVNKPEDDSRLEALSFKDCDFTLDQTYELIQWCIHQSLLHTLNFNYVTFHIPDPDAVEIIRAGFRKLHLSLTVERCWYLCNGSSNECEFTWSR